MTPPGSNFPSWWQLPAHLLNPINPAIFPETEKQNSVGGTPRLDCVRAQALNLQYLIKITHKLINLII